VVPAAAASVVADLRHYAHVWWVCCLLRRVGW